MGLSEPIGPAAPVEQKPVGNAKRYTGRSPLVVVQPAYTQQSSQSSSTPKPAEGNVVGALFIGGAIGFGLAWLAKRFIFKKKKKR